MLHPKAGLEFRNFAPYAARVATAAVSAALLMVVAACSAASQDVRLIEPPRSTVQPQYFGMHMHRVVAVPRANASMWPGIGIGAWRLWDAGVTWQDLEPARGRWSFAQLDSAVALAERQHVEVLLTLGVTPTWASQRPAEPSNYGLGGKAPPKDLNDWREYVSTVATRYRGRIGAYEIWNEPNLTDYFSGSATDLVELARTAYEVIKKVDSAAVVVSPSPSGQLRGAEWLDRYFALGGDRFLDAVGFHFYVTPAEPERMLQVARAVRGVMARHGLQHRALWNTETGWFMQNRLTVVPTKGPAGGFQSRVLNDAESVAWTARALVVGRCAGLERFYWYAWDNRLMGLTEADGRTTKSAGRAFATVKNWLLGATIERCEREANGVWVVTLSRPSSESTRIVWSESGRAIVSLPSGVDTVDSLPDGRPSALSSPDSSFVVEAQPVLVYHRR